MKNLKLTHARFDRTITNKDGTKIESNLTVNLPTPMNFSDSADWCDTNYPGWSHIHSSPDNPDNQNDGSDIEF